MSHVAHESLPGFHPDQIWKDGCPECEERSRNLSILTMDDNRFRYAWKRATDWGRATETEGTEYSRTELPLLSILWKMQVMFERACGLRIGQLPDLLGFLERHLRDAEDEREQGLQEADDNRRFDEMVDQNIAEGRDAYERRAF